MSRVYRFDPLTTTPIVTVKLFGPLAPARIRDGFDTGAACT